MKNTIILVSALFVLLLVAGTAISDSDGTPGGVVLDGTAVTMNLCAKTIPVNGVSWSNCTGMTPNATFSYEPRSASLKFNVFAGGLGLNGSDYPEVSGLSVVGVATSSLSWRWNTPNRPYFQNNIVTVTNGSNVIGGYPKTILSAPNVVVNHFVPGLVAGTTYTIRVQSSYSEDVITDANYSLIYYQNTSGALYNTSTESVQFLAQNMSVNGVGWFNGSYNISKNISAPGDRVWIVPTSEVNSTGFLNWTKNIAGKLYTNYLFESDLSVGVNYTYTP